LDTLAFVPAAPVVVVPTVTVAALPAVVFARTASGKEVVVLVVTVVPAVSVRR
jgi:hypothetical protein